MPTLIYMCVYPENIRKSFRLKKKKKKKKKELEMQPLPRSEFWVVFEILY